MLSRADPDASGYEVRHFVIGDWGTMGNTQHATYWIDNFRIMPSPDGIDWTFKQIVDQNWQELSFAPDLGGQQAGLWIAIAATASVDAFTYLSEDGGNSWRPATGDVANGGWRAVDYSESQGQFCAVSGDISTDGNKVITSPDGDNWTFQTTPASLE